MKVLIVYAKAGAGHQRAAQAVYDAFKRRGADKDVVLIDCLDYTNRWFKYLYPGCYLFLVRFLPFVWALIYYSLENRFFYSLIKPLRRLNNYLVSQRYADFIKKEKPQVIISTQFFATEVAAALKKKKEINATLISVVTDFGAHTFWESGDVDYFVVASADTQQDMLRRGIPQNKIKVLGIPIYPPLKAVNQEQLRREIGIKNERFTILIVGGGFGVGPIKKLVLKLNGLEEKVRNKSQLIVVCSRNKKLYKEIAGILPKLDIETKIFGFVSDLYKMMAASEVIISKSGGLTTSEALACGLPMIIIAPIAGQESKNCYLLVKKQAAIRIDRPSRVKGVIEKLVNRPDELEKMRRQALLLARPDSADELATFAIDKIKQLENNS